MAKTTKATAYLDALNKGASETITEAPSRPASARPATPETAGTAASASAVSRANKKHIGAYFDKGSEFLEQVAILRARLGMANAELIQHAIEELYRKEQSARAFGDR